MWEVGVLESVNLESLVRAIAVPFTVGRFVRLTFPLVILISTPDKFKVSILFKSRELKIPVPETCRLPEII